MTITAMVEPEPGNIQSCSPTQCISEIKKRANLTDDQYKDGFGPFTPGFSVISFGNTQALQEAITPNTVAFMVEPIQGEGGVLIPPNGYLEECQSLCKQNNVLLVLDEIQSGFGD